MYIDPRWFMQTHLPYCLEREGDSNYYTCINDNKNPVGVTRTSEGVDYYNINLGFLTDELESVQEV